MMPESVCFDEFFIIKKKRNFCSAFSVNIKQRRIANAIADGARLIKDSSAKQTRPRPFFIFQITQHKPLNEVQCVYKQERRLGKPPFFHKERSTNAQVLGAFAPRHRRREGRVCV